jgi:hypothetical protein
VEGIKGALGGPNQTKKKNCSEFLKEEQKGGFHFSLK